MKSQAEKRADWAARSVMALAASKEWAVRSEAIGKAWSEARAEEVHWSKRVALWSLEVERLDREAETELELEEDWRKFAEAARVMRSREAMTQKWVNDMAQEPAIENAMKTTTAEAEEEDPTP